MAFNNGLERRKFEDEWKRLRVEYAAAGMDAASIEELYQFDLAVFKSNRKFEEHRQDIPIQLFEDDGDPADYDNSALLEKFMDRFSVPSKETDETRRYGWMDLIDSPKLYAALNRLSTQQIEILTMIAFEGYSATEAGWILGLTQQGVSWNLSKIKMFLKKYKK